MNLRTDSVARRSAAIVLTSQLRSSSVRNFACSGRSVSTKNVMNPITTVGIASAMNMTCQPLRPNRPSRPSSAVDIGEPTATANGRPTRKPDTMRAW